MTTGWPHRYIKRYGHLLALGALSVVYIALQWNRFFTVLSTAPYDDTLQYNLSRSISGGGWLGTYNGSTLAKGVAFPAWTALLHTAHIPLWLGNSLLIIAACAAIIYALRRTILNRWILVAIYGLLLFNPMQPTRIYRDSVTPAIALLVCAWAIGMFLVLTTWHRYKTKPLPKDVLIFTIIGIGSLSAWYYIREDSIWLMPLVYLSVAGAFLYYLYDIHWQVKRYASVSCVIALLLITPFVAVKIVGMRIGVLNEHYYGQQVINDYISPDFEDAYAALTRIDDSSAKPLTVPVSHRMREKIYKVSPAFNKLSICLDNGGLCEGFKGSGPNNTTHDYEGGWFPWALRLAVQQAGYYDNATSAHKYYLELTNEVNNACRKQALSCHPAHVVALTPLPTKATVGPFARNTANAFSFLTLLHNQDSDSMFAPATQRSPNEDAIAAYYRVRYATPKLGTIGTLRYHILKTIFKLYGVINPVLWYISLITLAGTTIVYVRHRLLDWKIIVIAWLLLASIVLRVMMLAYVQTVSFPTTNIMYFSSVYSLMFLFEGVVIGIGVTYFRKIRAGAS